MNTIILYYFTEVDKMDWINFAKSVGFEDACELNMQSLHPMQEIRDMCAADRCKIFGTNWACPPGCGSLENCAKRIGRYRQGVLVQTIGTLEDDFDIEGIARANALHDRRFRTLARQMRQLMPACLPLSAGTCTRCTVCTYPNHPCRFPGKMLSSMEAYGLLVSDVCTQSGMPYYRGANRITFTSCILYDRKGE